MSRQPLCRQPQGLLPTPAANKIFMDIKPAVRSCINFVEMIEGLRRVSIAHRLSLNEIMERIAVVGGPVATLPAGH